MVLSVFTEGGFVVQAYLSVREVVARRLQHCRPERQPRRLPGPSKLDLFSENNKLDSHRGGQLYFVSTRIPWPLAKRRVPFFAAEDVSRSPTRKQVYGVVLNSCDTAAEYTNNKHPKRSAGINSLSHTHTHTKTLQHLSDEEPLFELVVGRTCSPDMSVR